VGVSPEPPSGLHGIDRFDEFNDLASPAEVEIPQTGDSPGERLPDWQETSLEPQLVIPDPRVGRWQPLVWWTALTVTGLLAWLAWRGGVSPRSATRLPQPPGDLADATATATADRGEDPERSGDRSSAGNSAAEADAENADLSLAERLALLDARLGELQPPIRQIVEEEGLFPAGSVAVGELPLSQRLSWQARLAARARGGVPPDWEAPWNAEVNDRFVRRRLVGFQNPILTQMVGEDGYPAGHFVGLAGVAEDLLPAVPPHLRRGILDPESGLSPREIRDGLADTILVTGVTRDLGSWAAGGRPTVRVFSGPPLIEGPEGLGTGTPGSLMVLMADGRVQSLSAEMDPQVFASLIAVGDQEPGERLSPDSPAVPAEEVPGAGMPPDPAGWADDREAGWLPLFASDEEGAWLTIDVPERLRVELLSFDQPPAARRQILRVLSGLAGVPIRWDRLEAGQAAALDLPTTLQLKRVTIQQLLEAVLRDTPLTWRVRGASIEIVPQSSTDRSGQPPEGQSAPATEQ